MPDTEAPELPFWPIMWILALAIFGASVTYSDIVRDVEKGSGHDPRADHKPKNIARSQNQQPTARRDTPTSAQQQEDLATSTSREWTEVGLQQSTPSGIHRTRRYDIYRVVVFVISLASQVCSGVGAFWCTRLLSGGCLAVLYWANEFTTLLPVVVVVVSTSGLLVCIPSAFGFSMMFLVSFWVYQVRNIQTVHRRGAFDQGELIWSGMKHEGV